MMQMMGFGGFGKKSRKTNVGAFYDKTLRNVQPTSTAKDEPIAEGPVRTSSSMAPAMNPAIVKAVPASDDEEDDSMKVGPPLPPGFAIPKLPSKPAVTAEKKKVATKVDDDDSDSSGDEEEEEDEHFIPCTHEIILNHGSKPITALAAEPSGNRFLSGGQDFDMKFWDFAGMDNSLQSFRQLTPCECHQMKSLKFSSTGENILVVAANSQAKVYDRDGYEVLECRKGDQYLNDMLRTRGHTTMLNDGCWHPAKKDEFLTCSNDGTVRAWSLEKEGKKCGLIRKCRDKAGRRTQPTCVCYGQVNGKMIVAGCNDGSIQLWDEKRKDRPNKVVRGAHMSGCAISSVEFSPDKVTFCTRGMDDTVKLWDVRNLKNDPIASACDLPNNFDVTNCTFSPNGKTLVTGVSTKKNEGKGKLMFMDSVNLEVISEIKVSDSSVIKAIWHERINQVFAATANGNIHVLYDVEKSVKGAKMCVVKRRKKINHTEVIVNHRIMTPYSLPLFREEPERSTKKQQEKDRRDHVKSHRPQPPLSTRGGAGGRLKAHGSTLASFVMRSIAKDKYDDSNPREAILRHADAAQSDPQWITHAYQDTQPETIFQTEDPDADEDPNSHIIVGSNKRPEEMDGPDSKRQKK